MTVPPGLWPRPERAGFRHRVGLRPLDLSSWVVVDDLLGPTLDGKDLLLSQRRADVFSAGPGTEAAAAELLALLVEHLRADHAGTHGVGDRSVEVAGRRVDLRALPPLDAAGRLVQDDWCLLDDSGRAVRLVAATLCSPSRWRLADKIGRGMPEVHAPVPGYAEELETVVDATLRRLVPARPVWRSNWTLTDDPALFQPVVGPPAPVVDAESAGAHVWLRVERQTLRRLPRTGAIVFGIRTFQERLDGLAGRPADAADLLAAVRQLPAATADYKSLRSHRPHVEAWLARCTNG